MARACEGQNAASVEFALRNARVHQNWRCLRAGRRNLGHAGLVRDAEGLQALADDPHPLARLIARHALLRAESRGAHRRSDRPETDPGLDLHHSVTRGGTDQPVFERWV